MEGKVLSVKKFKCHGCGAVHLIENKGMVKGHKHAQCNFCNKSLKFVKDSVVIEKE